MLGYTGLQGNLPVEHGGVGAVEDGAQRSAHRSGAVQRPLRAPQQFDPVDVDQVDIRRDGSRIEPGARWCADRRFAEIGRDGALARAGHTSYGQPLLQRAGIDRVERRRQPRQSTQVIGAAGGKGLA